VSRIIAVAENNLFRMALKKSWLGFLQFDLMIKSLGRQGAGNHKQDIKIPVKVQAAIGSGRYEGSFALYFQGYLDVICTTIGNFAFIIYRQNNRL